MPDINGLTKQYLLSLPARKFDDESIYDSIMLIPHSKHESNNYSLFAIAGLNKGIPVEIASLCDVIEFDFSGIDIGAYDFKVEVTNPEGITTFFSNRFRFKVHNSLSTTKVSLIEKNPEPLADE